MTRMKIGVGEEIDVLTPREFGQGLGLLMQQLQDAKTPDDMVISTVLQADPSTGIVPATPLFDVPTGYRAQVMRMITWVNGPTYTPAAPLQQGWITIHRGSTDTVPDLWFPGSGSTLAPALYEGGDDTSPRYRSGEVLVAKGAGLPLNQQVTIVGTIRLWGDVVRGKFDFGD